MTTTTKRITLLVLVLILALSVFAFASCDSLLPENTDVIFELNDNGTGYWVTKEGNFVAEELTIPATHQGVPVVGVKANAFKNNKTIKTITITASGDFTVDVSAFQKCKALQSLTIIATGKVELGNSAFSGCENLATVDIQAKDVTIGTYTMEYADNLTINVDADYLGIVGSAFFTDDENDVTTLNVTDCAVRLASDVDNASFTNCTISKMPSFIRNLVLDNTVITDDDMYLDVVNATFRGKVVYNNHYKKILVTPVGGIIQNLTIESIAQGSQFSQMYKDVKYPIAVNYTIGNEVNYFPSGVFGNGDISEMMEDVEEITITYNGASQTFYNIDGETRGNFNWMTGNYHLKSNDGQPAKVTVVDDKGETLFTVDTAVGQQLSLDQFLLPNTTLVPNRIIDGYYYDSQHTNMLDLNKDVVGDTTIYASFVSDELLSRAVLEVPENCPFTRDSSYVFSYITQEYEPLVLSYVSENLNWSQYASIDFFADEACTTDFSSIIDQVGVTTFYLKVTSWNKANSTVYQFNITVQDVHRVTFVANGKEQYTSNVIAGEKVRLPQSHPHIDGYSLIGWSTDGTEAGIVDSNFVPTSDMTLTGVYKKDVYTVTIRDTEHSYQLEWGDRLDLPTMEKQHYEFKGYSYDGEIVTTHRIDGDGKFVYYIERYNFGISINLTPVFEAIKYGVHLLDEKGNNNSTIIYTVEDATFTLNPATKDWYQFEGWFTQKDGQGDKVETINTSLAKEYFLYAHFTPQTYTVTFLDGQKVVDTQQFSYDNTGFAIPEVPQKDGYLSSWPVFEIVPQNIEVQVERTPILYTITYKNGYDCENTNPTEYNVEKEIQLAKLSRQHYEFIGWQNQDGQIVTQINKGTIGNITLTAQWAVAKYTIYMYSGSELLDSVKVEYNNQFNFDATFTPTADDKLFVGWYDQSLTTAVQGSVTVTGDINVYAKWQTCISISTAEDFEKIRQNPTETFRLLNDVDMRSEIVTPIEDFTGILDGNGYKLYNFILSVNDNISSFGLFKQSGGTIRNLTLDEVICSVTASVATNGENDYVGILVGKNYGTLYNCHVISPSFVVKSAISHSSLNNYFHVGGMAGINHGTVDNCTAQVVLTTNITNNNNSNYYGNYYCNTYVRIGGLVGTNDSTISNSSANLKVTSSGNATGTGKGNASNNYYAGGIAGVNNEGDTITQCFATVDINSSISRTNNEGYSRSYVGGLVGTNNGIIKQNYAQGTIKSYTQNEGYVGGFVGYDNTASDITNNYCSTAVTCSNAKSVGGFVGYLAGSVQNCYSTGDVNVTSSATNAGGFVGQIAAGGIANKSFTTSNINAAASNAGFFSANTSGGTGIIVNCYYSASATVLHKGTALERAEEDGAKREYLSLITSQDFLQNKMYFYPEYWIYTVDVPVLKWELQTDGTNLTNGSYYRCATCNTDYVNGVSTQPTFYYDKAATCTTDGIRYFACKTCNKNFAVITQSALGHAFSDNSAGMDFCNQDNTVTYTCTNKGCNYSYDKQYTATGHQHDHNNDCLDCGYTLVANTCDKDGSLTFVCDDCGQTVTKVIPAEHLWVFDEWHVEPTCTANGTALYTCSRCTENGLDSGKMGEMPNSKLGHLDTDNDGLCDRYGCDEVIFNIDEAIEIATLADLVAIANNSGSGSLGKTYKLTANIDLKGTSWEPIGTSSQPFTGVFLGNGFAISNVPVVSSNNTINYCGLFGYNSGVISGLTINYTHTNDFNEFVQNRNVTYGGICAYNNGTINDCTISGNLQMGFLTKAIVNEKGASASASQVVVLGLMVGENNGYIVNSKVTANYIFAFENYAFMGEEIDHFEPGLLTSGNYQNMIVNSKMEVVAGAICGKDNMSITNCTVSGTSNVYDYLAMSQFIDGKYGKLSATSSLTMGAIAGNRSLNNLQGNVVTGTISYSNPAGTHTPTQGNDPGNSFYSMSCSTTITIYQ
ncbi:MAG: InlB B-repeat-containing protein [Clostridia bacterium]|nr:InlB B-repeat-containing protein [Clostridia bacterium]